MKITARQQDFFGRYTTEPKHLQVCSNPFGALHLANSITVRIWDDTFGMWSHDTLRYQTITDFLADWHIIKARTHRIRIPFLRRTYGLGDMFALIAERAPLWFKARFNGCLDRREWWNWLLQISPLHPTHAQTSTLLFDTTMDIRRALRARGENPYDYRSAPTCDVCGTWVATHVIESKNGSAYLVCDKPRCQDRIAELLEKTNSITHKIEQGTAMGDADWADR